MSRLQQWVGAARRALTWQNAPLILDRIIEYGLYVYLFALFRATTWRGIAIVVVTAAWLLKLLLTRGADLGYLRLPVVRIGALFFGLTLLSVFYSSNVGAAAVEYAHTLGIAASMALVFAYALRDERVLRRVLILTLFLALYLNFIQIKGIVVEYSRTGALLHDVNVHRPHALSLIFYIPFLLALASLTQGRRAWWVMGAVVLQFVLLAATAGRAAIVSIAVALVVWALLHAHSVRFIKRTLIAGGIAVAVAVSLLALVPENSFIRTYISKGFYAADRIEATWKPTLMMIADNPLTGYGYGTFVYAQTFERKIPPDRLAEPFRGEWVKSLGPHNYYLETWFNSGLFALLAMLWLFLRFFADTWRACWAATDPLRRQLGAAVLVSFTALYLMHAQFGPLGPSGLRPLGVLLGIGVALLTMQRTHVRRVTAKKKTKR